MKKIETIIKGHIVEEIFQTFPTSENTHPFDLFIASDVNPANSVGDSLLGEKWGYATCEEYGFENIGSLRVLMQSMFDDLLKLQAAIFENIGVKLQVNKDEFSTSNSFYNYFAEHENASIHRECTNDEFMNFLTISWECVS